MKTPIETRLHLCTPPTGGILLTDNAEIAAEYGRPEATILPEIALTASSNGLAVLFKKPEIYRYHALLRSLSDQSSTRLAGTLDGYSVSLPYVLDDDKVLMPIPLGKVAAGAPWLSIKNTLHAVQKALLSIGFVPNEGALEALFIRNVALEAYQNAELLTDPIAIYKAYRESAGRCGACMSGKPSEYGGHPLHPTMAYGKTADPAAPFLALKIWRHPKARHIVARAIVRSDAPRSYWRVYADSGDPLSAELLRILQRETHGAVGISTYYGPPASELHGISLNYIPADADGDRFLFPWIDCENTGLLRVKKSETPGVLTLGSNEDRTEFPRLTGASFDSYRYLFGTWPDFDNESHRAAWIQRLESAE